MRRNDMKRNKDSWWVEGETGRGDGRETEKKKDFHFDKQRVLCDVLACLI